MSAEKIKYPVNNKKSAQDVQEQMARITSRLAKRVGKIEHKGGLSREGLTKVELVTETASGESKKISARHNPRGWKGSSYLLREVGEGEDVVKLDISSVAADTMHGWILKGVVEDPETGKHSLSGTESVHHLAKNFSELRSAVGVQEQASQAQSYQVDLGKADAIYKLYR